MSSTNPTTSTTTTTAPPSTTTTTTVPQSSGTTVSKEEDGNTDNSINTEASPPASAEKSMVSAIDPEGLKSITAAARSFSAEVAAVRKKLKSPEFTKTWTAINDTGITFQMTAEEEAAAAARSNARRSTTTPPPPQVNVHPQRSAVPISNPRVATPQKPYYTNNIPAAAAPPPNPLIFCAQCPRHPSGKVFQCQNCRARQNAAASFNQTSQPSYAPASSSVMMPPPPSAAVGFNSFGNVPGIYPQSVSNGGMTLPAGSALHGAAALAVSAKRKGSDASADNSKPKKKKRWVPTVAADWACETCGKSDVTPASRKQCTSCYRRGLRQKKRARKEAEKAAAEAASAAVPASNVADEIPFSTAALDSPAAFSLMEGPPLDMSLIMDFM